jgi:hypothetical protein
MKGKLVKQKNDWYIMCIEEGDWETYYPLHPYNLKQIEEDTKRFDNIEARIAAYPDVEFEIVKENVDTGALEAPYIKVKYAQLIPNTESEALDFLAEQAQELDMGYGLSEAEYEKACYWYGRGIHAGRNNLINELKPKR